MTNISLVARRVLIGVAGIVLGLTLGTSGLQAGLFASASAPASTSSSSSGMSPVGVQYPAGLADLGPGVTRFLIEPATGDLWFASIKPDGANRLHRYRQASGSLSSWALPSDPGGGWFVGLAFASDADLWIAWDQTLTRFHIPTGTSTRYAIPHETQFQVGDGRGKWVRTLAAADDGTLWLAREHAASLLRFDPVTGSFDERGLPGFGVPNRSTVGPDGRVWLTLARDALTQQEHTKVAVFDPRTGAIQILPLPLWSISFDGDGLAVGLGLVGLMKVGATGEIVERQPTPHRVAASDMVQTRGGRSVLTSRFNKVASFDWTTGAWSSEDLAVSTARMIGPPDYRGPRVIQTTAETTDVQIDSTRDVAWLLIASQKKFARIDLR